MGQHDSMSSQWAKRFPFVDDFSALVDGRVSWVYVDLIVPVLRTLIDSCERIASDSGWNPVTLRTMLVSVAALQRCVLVQSNRQLIVAARTQGDDDTTVSVYIQHVWQALVERDQMMFVGVDDQVGYMLDVAVSDTWRYFASMGIRTLGDVNLHFSELLLGVKFVQVCGIWVESRAGKSVDSMTANDLLKPVMPMDAYRVFMNYQRDSATLTIVTSVDNALSADFGYGYVPKSVVDDWVWLVNIYPNLNDGACYLRASHPAERMQLYHELGHYPTIAQFVESLGYRCRWWTDIPADCSVGTSVHVWSEGFFPDVTVDDNVVIGGDSPIDYYAKGLVDEFIAKHKPTTTYVNPLDNKLVRMSVDTSQCAGVREFVDLADVLYESAGKCLSPGARARGVSALSLVPPGNDHYLGVDEERTKDLCARLYDGAVIDEAYFDAALRRRFAKYWRPRPKLYESGGRAVHVFEGFPASTGAGLGLWAEDDQWDIAGWRSYVAQFRRDYNGTLSFVSPFEAADIRMDCTGCGSIDFGDCKMVIDATVVWFSNSVRFKLKTSTSVVIRISVPDSGQAMAVGSVLRRYLRISGFVLAIRTFDIPVRTQYVPFPVVRVKHTVGIGCYIYTGKHPFERGRHRLRITEVASTSPVKMLVSTEPSSALDSVEWCGVRIYSAPLSYAGLLYDTLRWPVEVSLGADAVITISILQIVDTGAFDIAVRSAMVVK